MNRSTAFFLLLLIATPLSSRSEQGPARECPEEGCSLEDLYIRALAITETGPILRERENQAEEGRSRAYGGFLPELELGVSHRYFHTETRRGWYMPTVSARIHQTIFSGLDSFQDLDAAELELERIRNENGREKLDLYENIAIDYFDLLKTRRLIHLREEALRLSEESLALLVRRHNLGRSRTSELLQERAIHARLEALRESLLLDEARLMEDLSYYTGLEPEALALRPLPEASPELPTLETAKKLVEDRPDVRAGKVEWQKARTERIRTEGAFLPELYVDGEYYFQRDVSIPGVNVGGKGDWNVEVGVTLPLFRGGSRFFDNRIAESKEKEKELVYRALLRMAGVEIRMAFVEWNRKKMEEEKYRSAMEMARKYYNSVLVESRRGMVTGLEVVRARMDSLEMEESYESARYDRALAEIRYLTTMGRTSVFRASSSGKGREETK